MKQTVSHFTDLRILLYYQRFKNIGKPPIFFPVVKKSFKLIFIGYLCQGIFHIRIGPACGNADLRNHQDNRSVQCGRQRGDFLTDAGAPGDTAIQKKRDIRPQFLCESGEECLGYRKIKKFT